MKFKTNFTKGRSLGLIALMLIGSFALASQTWYLVSMSPNDATVTLKSFDGYSAYAWVSPLLMVCLAAMVTSAISTAATRMASLWAGGLSSIALTLLSAFSISRQDLSGVSKEIETATGIAATHGISGLDIVTQPMALLSIGVFGALGLVFGLAIFASRHWKSKIARPTRQPGRPVKDSISLWDEQL
jgi:hypothetical protein